MPTANRQPFAPDTLLVLDFIEFVHASLTKPILGKYHDYFSHHHLTFDQEAGQEDFRVTVNRIFARNGVAFEMLPNGRIERVLPPVLGEELKRTLFNTGDRTLDNMLDECRAKFSDCNPLVRREALERLWDAWERLKSLADPSDKKRSVKIILDAVTSVPSLRERLETEARELSSIGNSHLIRHSEISQVPVMDVDQVDYLFHRLFAMIQLMLRKSSSWVAQELCGVSDALINGKDKSGRDAMLEWYLQVNALFRAMRQKAIDAQGLLESDDKAGAKLINGYLKSDYQLLRKLWTGAGFPEQDMGNLGRHIGFGDANDYDDILARDLPHVEVRAEAHVRDATGAKPSIGFEELLHPVIFAHAFQHYMDGHYRDAVLNSVVAIFDLMRERTGLDLDGAALATQVLSLERPHLILSELDTESGRNDQKGFMQILVGAYLGIRNPKAHSLNHDLDSEKAAQYLIFTSLLARRIYEAIDAPKI